MTPGLPPRSPPSGWPLDPALLLPQTPAGGFAFPVSPESGGNLWLEVSCHQCVALCCGRHGNLPSSIPLGSMTTSAPARSVQALHPVKSWFLTRPMWISPILPSLTHACSSPTTSRGARARYVISIAVAGTSRCSSNRSNKASSRAIAKFR